MFGRAFARVGVSEVAHGLLEAAADDIAGVARETVSVAGLERAPSLEMPTSE